MLRKSQIDELLVQTQKQCDTAKALFNRGKFAAAAGRYNIALDMLNACSGLQTETDHETTVAFQALKDERIRVLVNIAVCHKRSGNIMKTIETSSQAIHLDNKHVKALFLRGQAFSLDDKLEAAIQDFQSVLEFDPSNAQAKSELLRLETVKLQRHTSEEHVKCPVSEVGTLIGSSISRAQIIAALSEMAGAQLVSQTKITQLARRLVQERSNLLPEVRRPEIPFLEAYRLIEGLALPDDPLAEIGLTEESFHSLLVDFEGDDEVMFGVQKLLQPIGQGDPERAKAITLNQIIEVHKCMVREMQRILQEVRELTSNKMLALSKKRCESTAELLATIAVEEQLAISSDDVELAVVLNEELLQTHSEFTQYTEELSSCMKELGTLVNSDVPDLGNAD